MKLFILTALALGTYIIGLVQGVLIDSGHINMGFSVLIGLIVGVVIGVVVISQIENDL